MRLSVLLAVALFRAAAAAPSFALASIVKDHEHLHSEYDFVIVGGGTSGLTIADRLTEDPKSEMVQLKMAEHCQAKSTQRRCLL